MKYTGNHTTSYTRYPPTQMPNVFTQNRYLPPHKRLTPENFQIQRELEYLLDRNNPNDYDRIQELQEKKLELLNTEQPKVNWQL